jgi:DNA-binding MarR family transcriptional regulator
MNNVKLLLRALAKYWEILDYIAGHEDYMGKVAETVKVDLSRVSKAVRELENYGVVSVRVEPQEKRGGFKKYVSLTEKGKVIVEAVKYARTREYGGDWQVFLDEEGYRIKLDHSEKLLKKFIEESESTQITSSDLSNKYLIQHLSPRYYPETYRKYGKLVKSWRSLRRAREEFRKTVRNYATEKGFEIVNYEEIEEGKRQVSNIYGVVEAYLRCEDWERMRIVLKNGEVYDEYKKIGLARGEWLSKEVEELLRGLIHSEKVRKAFIKMRRAEERVDKATSNYIEDLKWLGLKVKHGEPLKSYCDLCPRVVIKHTFRKLGEAAGETGAT